MGTDPPITTKELTEGLHGVLNLLTWQTQLIQTLLQKIGPAAPPSSARRTKTRRKKPKKPNKPNKPNKPRKGEDARN